MDKIVDKEWLLNLNQLEYKETDDNIGFEYLLR